MGERFQKRKGQMKKKSRLAVILGLAILLLAACEKKEDYAPASDAEDKQKEILVQEEVEESTSSVEGSEYDFHENSIDQTFANFFHKNMCQVEYRDLQELYYIIWKAQNEKIIL